MISMSKVPPLHVKVVALPIGNVEDLSVRARRALESADLLFCEDTRKLGELTRRVGIELRARVFALPGGREFEFSFEKFMHEPEHRNWVLVSDAGTPVVN